MAAYDFYIARSRRICSLSHNSLHVLLSASFRQHDRQKNTHRLHAVGSNIVAGDVNGKPANFAYRRRYWVCRKHTLVLSKVYYSTILSYTSAHQYLRSLEAYPVYHCIF